MIPLSDELPTVRTPWMTYVILAVMIATWILVQGAGFNQEALGRQRLQSRDGPR